VAMESWDEPPGEQFVTKQFCEIKYYTINSTTQIEKKEQNVYIAICLDCEKYSSNGRA